MAEIIEMTKEYCQNGNLLLKNKNKGRKLNKDSNNDKFFSMFIGKTDEPLGKIWYGGRRT